jgi:hypothetical protein
MEVQRKQDIAVYYWLKDLFVSIPEITIVDGYPIADLILPTISVEAETIRSNPLELGSRDMVFPRLWDINVFGNTKTHRDSMAYTIINNLKNGIDVYDYDLGFPPIVLPKIGHLSVIQDSITATPIRIHPELVEKLYYRMSVRFILDYYNI